MKNPKNLEFQIGDLVIVDFITEAVYEGNVRRFKTVPPPTQFAVVTGMTYRYEGARDLNPDYVAFNRKAGTPARRFWLVRFGLTNKEHLVDEWDMRKWGVYGIDNNLIAMTIPFRHAKLSDADREHRRKLANEMIRDERGQFVE